MAYASHCGCYNRPHGTRRSQIAEDGYATQGFQDRKERAACRSPARARRATATPTSPAQARNEGLRSRSPTSSRRRPDHEREHAKRLLQATGRRRGGDHRRVPGGQDRHDAGEPDGRRRGRERRAGDRCTRNSPTSRARRASRRGQGFRSESRDRRGAARAALRALAANIEAGRVFKRDGKVGRRCRNCGYLHEGPRGAAASARPACTRRRTSSCWPRTGSTAIQHANAEPEVRHGGAHPRTAVS